MSRGLLHGSILFVASALAGSIFSSFAPMWLISRTELHVKLCWTGHGIWESGFVWGDDIPEMNLICEAPDGYPRSTSNEYCDGGGYPNDGDQSYRDKMCTATKNAKIFSIISPVVITITLASLVFLLNWVSYSEKVDHAKEVKYTSYLLTLTSLSFVTEFTKFLIMYESPLFSQDHYDDMSKNQPVPFNGFGCVFQSPFVNFKLSELIRSNPLQCLYAGPAFAMSAISFSTSFVACMLLAVKLSQHRKGKAERISGISTSMSARLLYPRRYSLYGAFYRRMTDVVFGDKAALATSTDDENDGTSFDHSISKRKYSSKAATCVMIMPVVILLNAALFAWMNCTNGAAVQVFIRISGNDKDLYVEPSVLRDHILPGARITELDTDYTTISGDKLTTNPIISLDGTHQNDIMVGKGKPFHFEIIEEVFDFTMLMSIKNFWDGKAYALAILTAVWCAMWPFIRVFTWLWYWFVPAEESTRGRFLTWYDALGKWSLVNFYVLSFMGVAFHLESNMTFTLLPDFLKPNSALKVSIEVSLGPRFATYLFIFGTIWSLILGEVMVYLHRIAKTWEEERRDKQARLSRSIENITQNAPLYDQTDTPYADGVRGRSGTIGRANFDAALDDVSLNAPLDQANIEIGSETPIGQSIVPSRGFSSTPKLSLISRKIVYRHGFGYEPLCDHLHSPVPGKKYRYTKLGRYGVWLTLGMTVSLILSGLLTPCIAFKFSGLVGDVIVSDDARVREYSLFSTGTSIKTDVGARPEMIEFLSSVYFIFTFIGPLLHVVCLTGMWAIPMRLSEQKSWFHFVELINAWSAIDVYLISLIAAALEIADLSEKILGNSFPGLEKLVDEKLPNSGGLFGVTVDLLDGIWVLLAGVMAEKLIAQFMIPQAAMAIADRSAQEEELLRVLQKQSRSDNAAFANVVSTNDSSSTPASSSNRLASGIRIPDIPQTLSEEISEHPETLVIMSPAARYEGASGMTTVIYSGLPRFVWNLGIKIGLMEEVTPEPLPDPSVVLLVD